MKRTLFNKIVLILLAVSLIFSITACGGSKESDTPAPETDGQGQEAAPPENEDSEPSAEPQEPEGGGEIALIPPAMVSPYYASFIKSATAAAEELGYKVTVLSPESESDFADQVKIVEDMIAKGVDGIALCSINDDAIVSAVKKANEAGIPVIFFNSSLTELAAGEIYTYIGFEEKPGVFNMVEWLNEERDGQANVGIIEGMPSTYATMRTGGFKEKAEDYPGIKVLASQPGDWEREKAMNVATNMLQAHPELDTFFANSDEMALGAAKAVQAAGKEGVTILSVDGNPNALEAITKGEMHATLGVNPGLTGKVTIEEMDKAIKGISAEKKMIVIPTVVIDKTNAAEFMD